jgi:hypothetical protein
MGDDLRSLYSKHLPPNADQAAAWTSFASGFLDGDDAAGGVAVVVIDESTLSGHTAKLGNLRLRLGDLLSSSVRTAATLVGLGLSSLAPSATLPLAVTQVLLFLRDVKRLQRIELGGQDVKLLLWLYECPSTWVDQDECVARFEDAVAALRRLELLGCVASEDGKWRLVEHVRLAALADG